MTATANRGVDIVLNFLTGDLLEASWRACTTFGSRFIEIGKRDILDSGNLDMKPFSNSATFTAFDITDIFTAGFKSPAWRTKYNK